ncbi:MAG: hypothetical protein KME64_28915 [Scytonematopsis contorta HA4267-MV1]|nr:hypothetical protein [Scytonematopsis contorta HA4267-MV1]
MNRNRDAINRNRDAINHNRDAINRNRDAINRRLYVTTIKNLSSLFLALLASWRFVT